MQYEMLYNILKDDFIDVFERILYVVEFTKRGNLHFHCLVTPNMNQRPQGKEFSLGFYLKYVFANYKSKYIFDLQIPKNVYKVIEYMKKDLAETYQLLTFIPYGTMNRMKVLENIKRREEEARRSEIAFFKWSEYIDNMKIEED